MELDQLELFAFADDRAAALEQLIPGTPDHYHYSCLLAQQRGDLDRAGELVAAWRKQHGESAAIAAIENRQALLLFGRDPGRAAETLRRRLGLRLDHQREVALAPGAHPCVVDQALLEREVLAARALADHPGTTDGFTDEALPWLTGRDLEPAARRHLLGRLRRPDVPGLARLVAADLETGPGRRAVNFGDHPIHGRLLPEQLAELAERRPEIEDDPSYVEARLRHLAPGPEEDRSDPAVERAFLARLWQEVEGLPPAFTSLRAHVLYHLLAADRRRGVYDRALFLRYLELPRDVGYAPLSIRRPGNRVPVAELGAAFATTGLPPVGSDEELVRDFLARFLAGAEDFRDFSPFIDSNVLRRLFAATKILAGEGELERWHAMIDDPAIFAELKERVDIELAPENPRCFAADEPVVLALDVKNVRALVVNVFEIDTANHFASHGRDVDTAVDLDGLVAGDTRTHRFDEPPFRRVRRRLEIDNLEKPGTYVIELIGAGKSSRALIRKGGLRWTERVGAGGHHFRAYGAGGEPATGATLHLGGRTYRAGEDGDIVVPFTTRPGAVTALLADGAVTTVIRFHHRAESYALRAGFFVERERLIAGGSAEVVIRPSLTVAGEPVGLSLLEEPRLVIETVDRRGTAARRELGDLELSSAAELVAELRVPEHLASIRFTLTARVRSLSTDSHVDLSDTASYSINGIDRTEHVHALHLGLAGGDHILHVLGKSGEPRPDLAVNLWLHHRDFTDPIEVVVQTDAEGRVELGTLAGIARVAATAAGGVSESWSLEPRGCGVPGAIHVRAGEAIELPVAADIDRVSLLRCAGGTYVADCAAAARLADGTLRIIDLEPGDYDLAVGGSSAAIRVSAGQRAGGWLLAATRSLEASRAQRPRITSIEEGADAVVVRVEGAGPRARVHAVATRFLPRHSLGHSLGFDQSPPPRVVAAAAAASHYVSGRDIGDEYRYILERRLADRYPGSAVSRPGLLLNPWARESTDTRRLDAAAGASYAAAGAPPPALARPAPAAQAASLPPPSGGFANLDFLAEDAARVVANGRLEDGAIAISRDALAGASALTVLVIDDGAAAVRRLGLAEPAADYRDLRLAAALDADRHFSETREVTAMLAGDLLAMGDVASSSLEVVDSLAAVHRIFAALSGNPTLSEFAFAVRWHDLDAVERRRLYSRYACHELHLFLSFKDPTFFAEVIQPHLTDKLDKTFLDRYLLDHDLARYLDPWAYGRLNTLERILLGGRIEGLAGPSARDLRDRFELSPRDVAREHRLFDAVIGGGALETADPLGFGEARREAAPVPKLARKRSEMRTRAGIAAPGAMDLAKAMAEESVDMDMPMEMAVEVSGPGGGDLDTLALADRRPEDHRRLFRPPERTREWAENNYYRLRPAEQGPELIAVNGFWVDYATRDADRPFLSPRFVEAASSFSEMMGALAVLDLPFAAGKHAAEYSRGAMELRVESPALVFHKEIQPIEAGERRVPVLISQHTFRADDRYLWEGGEQIEKYVSGDLVAHTVYLSQVVLTNPSSSRQRLQVLLQIPAGAIAVADGYPTRGVAVDLAPHGTESLEVGFYFPEPGEFAHYPAQVSRDEELVAAAEPVTWRVRADAEAPDPGSWAHVSQNGDDDQVLALLENANLHRLDLDRIAWRMRERGFFERALATLERRRVYSDTLWSYSLMHGEPRRVAEYLRHQESFLRRSGPALDASPVSLDPVERGWHEHLEYAPLVNARSHQLGARRQIPNRALEGNYRRFLDIVAHRNAPRPRDWLAAAYYQFLQDRVGDGLDAFARAGDAGATLQREYMSGFVALLRGELEEAAAIASRWRDYPVERWRDQFRGIEAALSRAAAAGAEIIDDDDPRQRQDHLAESEPGFDLEIAGDTVEVSYHRLEEIVVSYYLMDIELLFSRQPFLQRDTARFSMIQPNRREGIRLPEGRGSFGFDIPSDLHNRNLVIEVAAGGDRKARVHYAHRLSVRLAHAYGQLRVGARETGRAAPGVYVKVYARTSRGAVDFYKDGYTDLTGSFDYASISTDALDQVERFAILILSDELGSVIREAEPPPR